MVPSKGNGWTRTKDGHECNDGSLNSHAVDRHVWNNGSLQKKSIARLRQWMDTIEAMWTPVLYARILLLLNIHYGIAYKQYNNEELPVSDIKTKSNLGDTVSVPDEENDNLSPGLIVFPPNTHPKIIKQTFTREDGHNNDTYSSHDAVPIVEKAGLNGKENSVSEECVIEVEKRSVDRFRHLVFRSDSNFVF
ncbi:hypothetical protein MAR_021983, partial [Mya arenaria]